MEKQVFFGTSGIRGNASKYPFIPSALEKLGCAIGKWAESKYSGPNIKVLIGSDTRFSSDMIKQHLKYI